MADKPRSVGELIPLTDLCQPKQWRTIPKTALLESGYPVYGANGIIGYYDSYNHEKETLLIGCRGTCGKINVCKPKSYVTGNAMCLDSLDPSINIHYLEIFLRSYDFRTVVGGTSQPQITKRGLSKVLVPFTSIDRQLKIVDKFSCIQRQVEKSSSIIDELGSLVKSQFIEMFGDSSDGATIPLKECCSKICGGKTPSMKHPEYYGGSTPFIKSGDVKGDAVSSGALWLSDAALEQAGVKLVKRGSVLVVTRSALLQRKMCSALCANDVAINQDIKAFEPKEGFSGSYLLWAIRSHEQRLLAGVRSVSTSALDFDDLCNLPVKVASRFRQQEFSDFVVQVDKSRFVAQQQIGKLQMLYDSLVQEYFT